MATRCAAGRDPRRVVLYFAGFNRNKRSLTLNLRSDEGKAVLAQLIAGSDVLVDNFRPGVMEAMGFARRASRY